MIPNIIHQIWYQGEDKIPDTYPNYCDSWKRLNPGFIYMFWDESKIIKLIMFHYPRLLDRFNSYPRMIQKIDMAKYIILYHYGGVYADVDLECVKPIASLLVDSDLLLVQFNTNIIDRFVAFYQLTGDVLQNEFIASSKRNPFWKYCMDVLLNEDLKQGKYELNLQYVFRTSGPGIITKAYDKYPNKDKVKIVPSSQIEPISWCDYERSGCGKNDCKDKYPRAYTIPHYGSQHNTHSWNSKLERNAGMALCRLKNLIVGIILALIVLAVIAIVIVRNRS